MKMMFPSSRQVSLLSKKQLDHLIRKTDRLGAKPGAVFLDRDGTINYDRGYLRDPRQVRLLPRVGRAIRLLNEAGVLVIVVTNQTVVGRNEITNDELELINRTIWWRLRRSGAYYDALYYCPHDPTISPGCFCRKPAPGLIFQAAADFQVDPKRSFMVGDKLSDVQAGKAAGCKTVLIGPRNMEAYQADLVVPTLSRAVSAILQRLEFP